MSNTITFERYSEPARASASLRPGDDKAMLKAVADLTRDLNSPDRRIYWADLLLSALLMADGLALQAVQRQ